MKYLLIVILFLPFFGCRHNDPGTITEPVIQSSGKFSIQYANGLAKISAVQVSDTAIFDLGDLRGTKNYYFILENTGQTPITNISITSSDSTIDVSPSSIIRLDPQGSNGIIPIIKVTVNHGTVIENGVGIKPLQAMGSLVKSLHIEGTSDTLVNLTVHLNLFSYLLDFDVLENNTLVPLASFFGYRINEYHLVDSIYSIRNTGNIPLTFQRINSLAAQNPDTIFIPIGETFSDTIHFSFSDHRFININPTNTVFNQVKYHDDDYGSIAIAITRY